ncbi:MAG: ATP synthase F0 subunit B [Desulfobacterales bacterium]|jgi:F-type H+-transporting ATPase subunit b
MEIVSNIALISINETLVVQLVSFLLFVFIINRVMFRPLRSAMAERDRYMDRLREEVADAGKQLDQIGKDLRKTEEKVRSEAFRIQEAKKNEGNQEAMEIFEAARIEIEQEKLEATKKVSEQIAKARESLEEESRLVAASIMEKVLDRRVPS